MNENAPTTFSLQQAKETIIAAIHHLPAEVVSLVDAAQRIIVADIPAKVAIPSYDESTRDGFVIRETTDEAKKDGRYRVLLEIPAGKSAGKELTPGTAGRIMTGGCVPNGCSRVVPYEECTEQDGIVHISENSLCRKATFIRRRGSEIAQGEKLLPAGTVLRADHLSLLASCGIQAVPVSARPVVGYVCTGSELISGFEEPALGEKVSSNSYLLRGLIAVTGARPVSMGIIRDDSRDLRDFFARARADKEFQVLVTTGGMGPGKYDLVEKAFIAAGGRVLFNGIDMRPGKSLLFGILDQMLCFGLPGPPHAVRTLLNELVGPALHAMQGNTGEWPKKVQARLQHQVSRRKTGVLQLKDGVLTMAEGSCLVRFVNRLEVGNCFIVLAPERAHYSAGDLVEVHMAMN